ncbi:hydrolethalus syndrome 1-like protein [Labeo rohita]|uniref:Hydrolethalus syndrome 1-like protein n=1 Tax=Labeo rohita TaxID=84645 RepID=A0A498LSS7_LABRO|nr:hydrolethalus syndrome 1-like protein [Labeo rohita]
MESLDFSEEEIQQQLAALGYKNIPKERLREFKRDLDQLIRHEKSKSHSSSEWTSPTSHSSSSKSPPALIKEKVQLNNIGPSCNYVLFNSSAGQQREIFSSTFNEDDYGDHGMNRYYDSYSRHTVAHRPDRPSTAPNRLETEEGPSEIFHSVLDGSETTSPDREHQVHLKPVIKRKVLRRDLSIYLRMYKAFDSRWENESKDDEGSLSSSFWTDHESEGENRDYVKKENRANERKPEEDSMDVKESIIDEKKMEMLQGSELEKEKYLQAGEENHEVERKCFLDDENEKSTEVIRTRQKEEEESGDEEKQLEVEEEESKDVEKESEAEEEESEDVEKESEAEEEDSEDVEKESEAEEEESEDVEKESAEVEVESEEEEEESEEEEEESEEEEEGSRDEKEKVCEQQKGNENEEEEEITESEEEEKGKELEEEEEQNESEEMENVEKEESEKEEESEDEEKQLEEEEEESEEQEGKGQESEEEESEDDSGGSRDEKEDLCEQQKENEKQEEEELKESEEENKGKELEEEEEQNEAEESEEEEKEKASEEDKKEEENPEEGKESEVSEEEKDISEDEKYSEEEKESSVSGESSEESEESKVKIDVPECEKDQVSVEESKEESFLKEDSESEEKKNSLAKEGGSGEENSHFSWEEEDEEEKEDEEGDNICRIPKNGKGTKGKDDSKSFMNKVSISESERKNLRKELEEDRNNDEEQRDNEEQRDSFTQDSTDQDLDSEKEEERQCFMNKYKEIELGKSDEKEEDKRKYVFSDEDLEEKRLGAEEHENGTEEEKQHNSDEEDEEVSKGGSEEDEEREWFFSEPVEDKKDRDQDGKSWASDDDYVTIASGHSQKEEEENCNMIPTKEQERDDVQQKEDIRDVYVEDFYESLGSPAASILTSGYGTYRPDSPKDGEPEEVDYRDDCTLGGLEEENESILDARDYEDDSSLAWFRNNQALETTDGRASGELPDGNHVIVCSDQSHDGSEGDGHQSPDIPSQDHQTSHHQSPTENDSRTQVGGSVYFSDGWEVDNLDHPFNLRHRRGRVQRRPEEEQYDDGYDDSKKGRKEKRVRAYTGCLGTVSELEERLDHMRIGASRVHYDSESEEMGSYTDRSSSVTEESPSAFQEYIKGMARSHSESDIRPRPKSFIRPVFDHPHTRNLKKTDPVAKYLQYKQDWETFKPPGEKSRRDLHWAIRPRPQKTYIPNTYVVPTEKKRSALRWEIRHDLAHGIIPTKISYP